MSVHADIWRPVRAEAKAYDGFATFALYDDAGNSIKAFLDMPAQADAMADAFNAHQPKPAPQDATE